MNNIANAVNIETAVTDDCKLSSEMIEKIREREKAIEKHPDTWVTIEQLKKDLAEI